MEKTICSEQQSFLSQFETFLNTKPLRSEIDEVEIALKPLPLNRAKKSGKPEIRYEIQGKVNGKLGRVTFRPLPASILPTSLHPEADHSQKWLAQVSMRKTLPRALILAVEHFLITFRGPSKRGR